MYAYIKGMLVESTPKEAILDVNGVGYALLIPISDFGRLPQVGSPLLLYTSFIVRELSQTLYGFLKREGRDLFEELIGITGIGPKMGLSIIGHLTPEELQEAVRSHDIARFIRVPGIGKKTAERLLVEMQGRFKLTTMSYVPQSKGHVSDALTALMQLGYSQTAAEKAICKAAEGLASDCDLSALITAALKQRA